MGTPTCMAKPALSTRVRDSGGALLRTIQDFPDMGREDMGRDIDRGIPIIIPVPAFPRAGRFLTPAGQALVLRLHRMHRHNFLSESRRGEYPGILVDTFSRPVVASPLRAG